MSDIQDLSICEAVGKVSLLNEALSKSKVYYIGTEKIALLNVEGLKAVTMSFRTLETEVSNIHFDKLHRPYIVVYNHNPPFRHLPNNILLESFKEQ